MRYAGWMSKRFRSLLPWLLTLVILGYLWLTNDPVEIWAAMQQADLTTFVLVVVVWTVAVYLVDSLGLWALFRRFFPGVTAGDVLAIRGASYFLNAIDYSAASGGMAYFLKRKRAVPFLGSVSAFLWLGFIDVLAMTVVMTTAFPFAAGVFDAHVADKIPLILGISWVVLLGVFAYWQLGWNLVFLGRVRNWTIFRVFDRATFRDCVEMCGARLLLIATHLLATWILLPTFHIHVELPLLAIYAPLIAFAAILPGSVSGLGAVQLLMISLYGPHVSPDIVDPAARAAQVVAYSTLLGPAFTLLRLPIGYLFVANIARDFLPKKDDIARERAG